MPRYVKASAAPETQPHEFLSRCRRTCCWTPYGHTPREGCTCHKEAND